MKFLDETKIFLKSGDGGNGCVGFRREKYIEFGGPDGGNGGRGGNIIFLCIDGLNTLIDYRYTQHFKAKRGIDGMGQNRAGAKGEDIILKVPVGTQILDNEKKNVLQDFIKPGQTHVFLKGGNGGFGNAHFKSSTNQAPRNANPGLPGEELWIWLRLKLIADAGIVGLPNAGKSTFLTTVSRAHPKIADYPFTTLHPNLGVVNALGKEFVMADLPGLIEGASQGTGLGIRFLGHAERCGVILHLIAGDQTDVVAQYHILRNELKAYGGELPQKEEIVALSKCDILSKESVLHKKEILEREIDKEVIVLSSLSKEGVSTVIKKIHRIIDKRHLMENEQTEFFESSRL